MTVRALLRIGDAGLAAEIRTLLGESGDIVPVDPGDADADRADVVLTDTSNLTDVVADDAHRDDRSSLPVVALVEPEDDAIGDALRSGARAAVSAHADADMIAAACIAAAAGLSARPARRGARRAGAPPARTHDCLTPRERDVLRLLAEGLGNKAIARRLGIAPDTAKAHVSAILAKLDARTRTEAVAIGARRGMIVL